MSIKESTCYCKNHSLSKEITIRGLVLALLLFASLALIKSEALAEDNCGEYAEFDMGNTEEDYEKNDVMVCLGNHLLDDCSEAKADLGGWMFQIKGGTLNNCVIGNNEGSQAINIEDTIKMIEAKEGQDSAQLYPGGLVFVSIWLAYVDAYNNEKDEDNTIVEQDVVTVQDSDLYSRLKGKIILRAEKNGEAYYVNPADELLYSLGRPDDAFAVMREQGVGISNSDLNKIPVGLSDLNGDDSDNDGLSDMFEDAVGTDKNKQDTDGDGYDDKMEITGDYDPTKGHGAKLPIDSKFAEKQKGKIFLQVENNGEAWYVNPADSKRYFLGRPGDAFNVTRRLGLGVSEDNFKLIVGENAISEDPVQPIQPDQPTQPVQPIINDPEHQEWPDNNEPPVSTSCSCDVNAPGMIIIEGINGSGLVFSDTARFRPESVATVIGDTLFPVLGFQFKVKQVKEQAVVRIDVPAGVFDPAECYSVINARGDIRNGLGWYQVIGGEEWRRMDNIPVEIDKANSAFLVTLEDGGIEDADGQVNGEIWVEAGAIGSNCY